MILHNDSGKVPLSKVSATALHTRQAARSDRHRTHAHHRTARDRLTRTRLTRRLPAPTARQHSHTRCTAAGCGQREGGEGQDATWCTRACLGPPTAVGRGATRRGPRTEPQLAAVPTTQRLLHTPHRSCSSARSAQRAALRPHPPSTSPPSAPLLPPTRHTPHSAHRLPSTRCTSHAAADGGQERQKLEACTTNPIPSATQARGAKGANARAGGRVDMLRRTISAARRAGPSQTGSSPSESHNHPCARGNQHAVSVPGTPDPPPCCAPRAHATG